MASLFLSIASEEIPARMQQGAGQDLQRLIMAALQEAGLAPQSPKAFWGPRHIAIEIGQLLTQQPDREIEKRGPRIEAPDKAIEGFCQSVGMTKDELVQEDTGKGVFYFARKSEKGQSAAHLLPEMIQQILSNFPWPKSQRWGTSRRTWVRPMHQIALLLDGQVIEGSFDLGGDMSIAFGNQASGHPFHKNETFSFSDAAEWQAKSRDHFVIVDADKKAEMITTQIAAKTKALEIEVVADEGLLKEVTGLVEWPNAIIGQIAPEHMALPAEVLITSMRVHQKYFATRYVSGDKKGQIAPYFITIANRLADATTDTLIQQGNERVLRARLADAAFFYDQDRSQDLSSYVPQLDSITFYEGLGSVGDKVSRVVKLAQAITPYVTGADEQAAQTAAGLAKADLVTEMVGEFPELQGLMGGYYARHHGLESRIAQAIADHYKPAGPSDSVPSTAEGIVVSLADKIDTLVGFFGIGAKPTGSKDPFALRRAALSIIRMIDECDVALPLADICQIAAHHYGFDSLDEDVSSFVRDRLTVRLRDKGLAHDVVAAALHGVGFENPRLMMMKATKLQAALRADGGADLVAGFKRANNILAAERKKAKGELPTSVDETIFVAHEETALYKALKAIPNIAISSDEELDNMLGALNGLVAPINDFFESIIVNDDDQSVRANRLALLSQTVSQMGIMADFTKIEGG